MTSIKNLFIRKIKTCLIAGIVVVAPIGLTIIVVQWLVNVVDSLLYTILPVSYQPDKLFGFHIPGLGILWGILIILIVGFIASNYLGTQIVHFTEEVVKKIPLVNSIHSLFKQVADTAIGSGGKGFRKPVLLEYPRKEIWSIGFMTGVSVGEVQDITSQRVINVFVPTTPNPTSGFYVLVPEKDVIPLSMTVEDAFKLIVSGGMVTPIKDKSSN